MATKNLKKLLSIILVIAMIISLGVTALAVVVPTVTINSGAASVTVEKSGTKTLTTGITVFKVDSTHRVAYAWTSNNGNVTFSGSTSQSTATISGAGALNSSAIITVTATQQYKNNGTWKNDTATATDTIIVNVIRLYDHVDVEMNGTQVISTQNPDSSFTDKNYSIVVSSPAFSFDGTNWDSTPSSTTYSGSQREFRFTGLNFDSTATIYIKCHIKATNTADSTDQHEGDLSLVFTATTGFEKAYNDCPGKSGLDFTITDAQVIKCLSFDVTYVWTDAPPSGATLPAAATYLQGNDVALDTAYTAGKVVEIGSDNYTFSGWFTSSAYSTAAANINDIAANTTFYGYWTKTTDPAEKYGVTYSYTAASGTLPSAISTNSGSFAVSDATTYPESASVDLVSAAPAVGTEYAVADGTWTLTSWSTHPVNMTSAGVSFVGTWTFERNQVSDFATLKVTKQVSGSDTSDAFDILVTFSYDGSLQLITSGTGSVSGFVDNAYTISLQDGEYVQFSGIPYGTSYTVVETTQLSSGWSKSGEDSGSFYNTDSETVNSSDEVLIVNTYRSGDEPVPTPTPVIINYGSLSVSKSVSGDGASATEKFAITVTFTPGAPDFWNVLGISAPAGAAGGNGVYTLSLSANDGPVTFTNIPVGTTYTVSEAIDPTAQAGWTEGASTGKTGPITAAGAAAEIKNVYAAGVESANDNAGSEQGVAGATDVLPQTGGISPSTLLGLLGLALIAAGGSALLIIRKKNHSKNH